MARIQQLSKHLINQIAAGEVIERPASVVKELVENSIDAGSGRISIEITNDCRDIRIADNGCGIHPDDIYLAFSKHATSKIRESEDLFDIHTLGFRGEALASIISIAKLTCTTRTKDYDHGTRVKCENSEVDKIETSCAVGTIMEVKDLFYNLPARLKFLKNSNTEFSYIQELIQNLALSHPEVAFELKKNGKTVLKTTGQNMPLLTIKEIYGEEVSKNLKEVCRTDELSGLKISGYVSTPDLTRSSKKYYHIYINSRTVKCPVFLKSIDTAYKSLIAIGKYPIVVLNLELPASDVDVNVHPTKKEVRYKNPNQIFNFIMSAIHAGLANYAERPSNIIEINQPTQRRFENPEVQVESPTVINLMFPRSEDDTIYLSEEKTQEIVEAREEEISQTQIFSPVETAAPEPEDKIIGQYKNTYILIEKEDGLEIVDQHIAEERYLYEKLMSEKEIISQMLFISDVQTVSATDAALIKENIAKFERFGYGIEFISDTELIFRKVPQMLSKVNPKEILTDILEHIEGDIDHLEEKILITTSCKAAVKAGQKLSTWQMQEIIKKWRTTKMPYTCPHGRPICKFFEHKDLAKFFQRNN
ncbi:MAG: DNA mismatch repair endonuclease MutL [Fusobacterium sp.]|nr:DNA mismatch repair endonuclease MutL [Fusobacterium sp.]